MVKARTVVRHTYTALFWLIAGPLVVIWVGSLLALAPWAVSLFAALAVVAAVALKPPMWVEIVSGDSPRTQAGAKAPDVELVVRRWMKSRRYTLAELTWISVNEFKVSVPLTYLEFADGQHVGPLLTGDDSVGFVTQLIAELKARGRESDTRFWENVMALERYFLRSSK